MYYLIAGIVLLVWLDRVQAKPQPTSAEQKAINRVLGYWQQIQTAATNAGVSPRLLAALVYVESKGMVSAKRIEPDGRTSYGLTQILCSTAQDMGFTGKCTDLFDSSVNLAWGAKYLKSRINLYGLDLGILSYNTGSPRHDQSGKLYDPNQYIRKVKAAFNHFGTTG